MRKVLTVGSIIAVVLLVLVTFNPVVNVQAMRSVPLSRIKNNDWNLGPFLGNIIILIVIMIKLFTSGSPSNLFDWHLGDLSSALFGLLLYLVYWWNYYHNNPPY